MLRYRHDGQTMKRDYPLFTIDRTKSSSYPFDYITCYNREVGFIARVLVLHTDDAFDEFKKHTSVVENHEISIYLHPLKRGGIAIVVEDFFYSFDVNTQTKSRIQTLMKKAVKKYLHATFESEPDGDDFGINNQIKQQELTIERNKSNFDALVARCPDRESAIYSIQLSEAILETLKKYKEMMQLSKLIENE